jgi:conjugative transposon TraN protein
MKRICARLITGILFLLQYNFSFSQSRIASYHTISIEPAHLTLTYSKTTNLIFPSAIKSVDRGSPDVLAQKAKGVENVLLVKAGRENFKETNLSVITADNKLYSFVVDYVGNPSSLTILVTDNPTKEVTPSLLSHRNEGELQKAARKVLHESPMFPALEDHKFKIQFHLRGLYIKDDLIFCPVEIKNSSFINYDIALLRFFIRDTKRAKRTATQEVEIHPVYKYGNASVVKGRSTQMLVFALPKFTISDKKHLTIQLMERHGGRHLQLKVRNRTLVKSRPIPSL